MLYCSTGDGGRRSQRYHPQSGTVLFCVGLRTSHVYVLRVAILNDYVYEPTQALYIMKKRLILYPKLSNQRERGYFGSISWTFLLCKSCFVCYVIHCQCALILVWNALASIQCIYYCRCTPLHFYVKIYDIWAIRFYLSNRHAYIFLNIFESYKKIMTMARHSISFAFGHISPLWTRYV